MKMTNLLFTIFFISFAVCAQKSTTSTYEIENFDFNSERSDFAPTFYGDHLIFSSNRNGNKTKKTKTTEDDRQFFDLLLFNKSTGEIEPFSKRVNTRYHESTAVFTKDKQTVYFTRSNYTKRVLRSDSIDKNHLKLYRGVLNKGKWKIVELPFNNDQYSIAHPALSKDEKTLFFVSDMPGSDGETDIYKVAIELNGFGTIERLSAPVNTRFKETFPFIDENDDLYFSSDRDGGLGSLDIYKARRENSEYTIENLGDPINSQADDITFIINSEAKGYFSSNRMGVDDIYSFIKILTPVEIPVCTKEIKGFITAGRPDQNVSGVVVSVYDENNNIIQSTTSDALGVYSIASPLDCDTSYSIGARLDENSEVRKPFQSSSDVSMEFNFSVEEMTDIDRDSKLVKLEINTINFDSNKFNIRRDARAILNAIAATMSENPSVNINIAAYTDAKGKSSYNLLLSEKRARATKTYLMSQGIAADRIKNVKGFGENNLLNNCGDLSRCSDREHEVNRRAEVEIAVD